MTRCTQRRNGIICKCFWMWFIKSERGRLDWKISLADGKWVADRCSLVQGQISLALIDSINGATSGRPITGWPAISADEALACENQLNDHQHLLRVFFFTTKNFVLRSVKNFWFWELRPRWLAAARIGHFASWWWCRLCKLAGIFPATEHRPPIPSWFRWINVFHPLDSNLKFPLFFPAAVWCAPLERRHSTLAFRRLFSHVVRSLH